MYKHVDMNVFKERHGAPGANPIVPEGLADKFIYEFLNKINQELVLAIHSWTFNEHKVIQQQVMKEQVRKKSSNPSIEDVQKEILERKERQQELVDTIDQIVFQKMKDEKLYLFKEGHDPKVDREKSERMDSIVGMSVESIPKPDTLTVTPMTEIAQVDMELAEVGQVKKSSAINQESTTIVKEAGVPEKRFGAAAIQSNVGDNKKSLLTQPMDTTPAAVSITQPFNLTYQDSSQQAMHKAIS